MDSLLRVLLIEDVPVEAQQILHELRTGGYNVDYHCVETRGELETALLQRGWDLILCDDNVPTLNPIEALSVLQESGHALPFLLRAGTSGNNTLVTIIHAVARDYIVTENLVPLLTGLAHEIRNI